jgi:TRAP-type C4-dicarboxylate transport system permease small subunit
VAHAKTFIGWSIALTICCCGSPFSIAALVGSIITIMRNGAGDEERAQKASRVTEWLIIIAIALGVPMMFIYSLLSAI